MGKVRAALLIALTAVWGCGMDDGPPRRIVEGTVSYSSVPLEHGLIRFVPAEKGPVATAVIEKGKYRVTNKGGVPLGTVRVEITATRASEMSEEEILERGAPPPVVLPSKFNQDSTLSATIPAGAGSFVLDYDLTAKDGNK
jgi:hypothetical protein